MVELNIDGIEGAKKGADMSGRPAAFGRERPVVTACNRPKVDSLIKGNPPVPYSALEAKSDST